MAYDDKKKVEILRGYLRSFFVTVTEEEKNRFDKLKVDMVHNYTVVGDHKIYRKFCAYYLLQGGRKSWDCINAYTLIEVFLGHVEDTPSIFELNAPYVILTYGADEMENKRQWDIINQYISWRFLQGYRTVIFLFSRSAYSQYRAKFSEEMRSVFQVIEL